MFKKLEVEDDDTREGRICKSSSSYQPVIDRRSIVDLLSKLNRTSRPLQSREFGSGNRPMIQALDPPNDGKSISFKCHTDP